MPSRRVLLLIAALFLLVVLLRLPAAWVVPALPAPLSCDSPAGTAWSGRCGALHVGPYSLANLDWQLLPGELLHARLGVEARLSDAAIQASGKALVGLTGSLRGDNVQATLAVPSALTPGIPAGWSGTLEVDLPQLVAQGASLRSVNGTVRLRGLQQGPQHVDYGSFEWQLAGGEVRDGGVSGALRDLGGPVRLQGTLALGLKGEYDLNAKLAPAPGASDSVQQLLQRMGPADAQGFHSLLAAGSL